MLLGLLPVPVLMLGFREESVVEGCGEFIDLPTRLFLGNAVRLLNLAHQLFAFPGGFGDMVIRQLAPLLQDVALQLFPVSRDEIPIQRCSVLNLGVW